ncbi:MAG TPA: DUF58 domain-containing protein [Candidatus Sulfotelmatobacter sp.]|nr:DUF58 domain-containing protein [Candidatus Sulfotelmatobacter sp.]
MLWCLLWPRRHERIQPTLSGAVLIGLSFGIGTAAYNSASNILFIALSLLLACLILSGVLSWLNLRRLDWQLEIMPRLRAGQETEVGLLLRNAKKFLPTYALWFEFAARPFERGEPARPESTITARGIDVWAALARVPEAGAGGTVHLRTRLDPGGEARLDWTFTPARRGLLRIEVLGVGSLFPFGFLRKLTGVELHTDVPVWPAPVEYRRFAGAGPRRPPGDLQQARAGNEGDMIGLRRYEPGDSHRLIHWKASARMGRLLIRQHSAQTSEACAIWLRTDAAVWTRPDQFELLMSLAATLAQDLFRAGRLESAAIDAGPQVAMRRVADLESFLDGLAEARPLPATREGTAATADAGRQRLNLLTFEPDGARGVAAFINGIKTAAT